MSRTRRWIQGALLGLVIASVLTGGVNCERWCPFGGVEGLYTYALEGNMVCSLSTSNFFILVGVLVSTLLLRRAFCGYMCPLGTISEWVYATGRHWKMPALKVPPKVERYLALLKYLGLAVILALTWRAGELIFRGFDPCYALISRHGADITHWAYVVSGGIVFASLFLSLPFCRWLCPFAAVLNPFSRFAVSRIVRHTESCRDCGLCAKKCPMAIPVDRLDRVTAARCTSCLNCVTVCPAGRAETPALTWGFPRPVDRRWARAALLTVLLVCTSAAVAGAYLFPLPSFIKSRGTPPRQMASVTLDVENLTCRGRANLLVYFLERDDLFAVPGYLKLEAWPQTGWAPIRISYDPELTDETALLQAITEPYFESAAGHWRSSPFRIAGYDPLEVR